MTESICSICPRCNGSKKLSIKDAWEYGHVDFCTSCKTISNKLTIKYFRVFNYMPVEKSLINDDDLYYCDDCNRKIEEFMKQPCKICEGKGVVWK